MYTHTQIHTHTHTHTYTHSHIDTHTHTHHCSDLCPDRFIVICFRKGSHHCFFPIYATGSVYLWTDIQELFFDQTIVWHRSCQYCQLRLVLYVTRLIQCDTQIFACSKIRVQLRFSSRVNVRYSVFNSMEGQLDVWHISFSLSLSGVKISTTSLRHFLTNSPSLHGFLARAIFQASWYDASITVSECFLHF